MDARAAGSGPVHRAVFGAEVNTQHLLLPGRQFGRHPVLRAPQQEGPDASTQGGEPLATYPLGDLRGSARADATGDTGHRLLDRPDVAALEFRATGKDRGRRSRTAHRRSVSEFSSGVPVMASLNGSRTARSAH